MLVYVQVASGFRPGGINIVPGLDLALAVYRDDRLVSWEAGGRFELDGERLRLDGMIYHQHRADMQYVACAAGGYSLITKIGGAHIRDCELSLNWEPSPTLTARLDATYTDATLANDPPSAPPAYPPAKAIDCPMFAPIVMDASLLLDRPIGDRLHLPGSIHARYIGRSHAAFPGIADASTLAMGYTGTVDGSVGLSRGGVQVALFAENIANTRGQLSTVANLGDKILPWW